MTLLNVKYFKSRGYSIIHAAKLKQQLSDLQKQFKESMSDIEDKSALLREVIARINTTSTPQQLKEGLMALTGTSADSWSDNDWDSFVNGNKSLTI